MIKTYMKNEQLLSSFERAILQRELEWQIERHNKQADKRCKVEAAERDVIKAQQDAYLEALTANLSRLPLAKHSNIP